MSDDTNGTNGKRRRRYQHVEETQADRVRVEWAMRVRDGDVNLRANGELVGWLDSRGQLLLCVGKWTGARGEPVPFHVATLAVGEEKEEAAGAPQEHGEESA